jgi:hypothetical protein
MVSKSKRRSMSRRCEIVGVGKRTPPSSPTWEAKPTLFCEALESLELGRSSPSLRSLNVTVFSLSPYEPVELGGLADSRPVCCCSDTAREVVTRWSRQGMALRWFAQKRT